MRIYAPQSPLFLFAPFINPFLYFFFLLPPKNNHRQSRSSSPLRQIIVAPIAVTSFSDPPALPGAISSASEGLNNSGTELAHNASPTASPALSPSALIPSATHATPLSAEVARLDVQ